MIDSFQSLNLKYSYSTLNNDNVITDFLLPTLQLTKNYYRSVGFFTVESMSKISIGINKIISGKGKINLLCSYVLSDEDIEVLEKGYEEKQKLLDNKIFNEFNNDSLSTLSVNNKEKLIQLIKYDLLDIKIIVKDKRSLFHDKVGILEDHFGNQITFIGSMNDTIHGYEINYEKIRVFKSWKPNELDFIQNEIKEFNSFWNNENPSLKTYTIPQAIKEKIIERLDKHQNSKDLNARTDFSTESQTIVKTNSKPTSVIKLRDYQAQAIQKWKQNGFNGFYKMATGTGKTWTAIYSIVEIFKSRNPIVIITAPYKHLIEQWYLDITEIFKEVNIVKISSDYKNWRGDLSFLINNNNLNFNNKLIIVSTLNSFKLKDFENILSFSKNEKLLVADEAHRIESFLNKSNIDFNFRLGLSATPEFFNQVEKTDNLLNYFGGVVFEYDLEVAINNGYLVEYEYIPYFMKVTEDEQNTYKYFQSRIAGCFKNGKLICKQEKLMSLIRSKRNVLSKAFEKDNRFKEIIKKIPEKSNLIVYCGDGISNFTDRPANFRFIDRITSKLKELDYKVHKFTAEEDIKTRMELIEDFEKQNVDALVAIKCLDEGVNIPSIKNALILASTEDPREFIQRRGRILRKHKDKTLSRIYDVIMLPFDITGLAILKSEFKRYYEYSNLAINKERLIENLISSLDEYNLDLSSLENEYNEEDVMEDILDE